MTYCDAVEILEDLEFKFRRIARVCEIEEKERGKISLKKLEYERLADALETVLKGDQNDGT